MQLKFRRSTGSKGMLSKSTTYILDATMNATTEEGELIVRFGKSGSIVWNYADDTMQSGDRQDEVWTELNRTTFQDLSSGRRYEYEKFNSVIRTENDIKAACQSLLHTCETLATFDGRERVLEITADEITKVAEG